MRRETRKKCLAALLSCLCLTAGFTGCGKEEQAAASPDDIALVEPVGAGESYELVTRRNLYAASTYDGKICPYGEEYSLDNGMYFDSYALLPGDPVKKGQTIIRTNTESMDEQIKNMEEQIARDEESYREYLESARENLEKAKKDEEVWGGALEKTAAEEPEEYVTITNEEGGTEEVENPEYAKWSADCQMYESRYRSALIRRQKQEAAMEQRKGYYELDRSYNLLLLQRLREEKKNATIVSEMDGVVANIRFLEVGNYMGEGVAQVAVADPTRRTLKCQYVNRENVSRAEQVFAVINGKRYDVVYKPLTNEEYDRLKEENDVVFATFEVLAPDEEIELGTFGVVVLINKARPDALTVPKNVVQKGEETSYVYVLKDGERVYTPVETGIQDGLYVEILSGLEEGEKVLVDANSVTPAEKAEKTATLSYGSVETVLSMSGDLRYTSMEWIGNPVTYGTAYLGEVMVGVRQQVKKGDLLFTLRVEPDNMELARTERSLQRQQERLADFRKGVDETDKAVKKAIEAREESIAELEKKIREMKADFAVTEVRAPYDGVIVSYTYELYWGGKLKEGSLIPRNQGLLLLAPMESKYIVTAIDNDQLTFGEKVTLNYTSVDGSAKSGEAEVVSMNRSVVNRGIMNMNVSRGWSSTTSRCAIIRMSPEVVADMADSIRGEQNYFYTPEFKITAATRKMENVLLIPRSAVVANGNSFYAKVVQEDGSVVYQGFVSGGADSDNYWVVEGLTEGMKVCLE